MRLALREGSASERSYRFRPPDPTWASTRLMEDVRSALRRFDPGVGIWWSMHRRADRDGIRPGRWRVVEWMPRLSNWTTAFFWEGPQGEYRDPWPAEAICARLGSIQVGLKDLQRNMEAANERRERERQRALHEGLDEFAKDYTQRALGQKETFLLDATGRPRQRGGMFRVGPDDHHMRWLRQQFAGGGPP